MFNKLTNFIKLKGNNISLLYHSNKATILFYSKNIVYVLLWGIVAFCSAYNETITNWHINIFPEEPFSRTDIMFPLIIWMCAFYLDFIITLNRPPEGYEINLVNLKASYFVMFIYLSLVTIFIGCPIKEIVEVSFWCIFITMLVFKWLSLDLFYKREQIR